MSRVCLWVPEHLLREMHELQQPDDNWSAWFQRAARQKLRARRAETSPARPPENGAARQTPRTSPTKRM